MAVGATKVAPRREENGGYSIRIVHEARFLDSSEFHGSITQVSVRQPREKLVCQMFF